MHVEIPCVINYTVCPVLVFYPHGLLLHFFLPVFVLPCCAPLFGVHPLWMLLSLIWYFTLSGKYQRIRLPWCWMPLPLFLSCSVDICVPVSVPLSFTLFLLIPFPHTLPVLALWAVHVCIEALETSFFLKLPSHLAALYSTYPRRGLTAGNITRMGMHRDWMHIHSCTIPTHTNTL